MNKTNDLKLQISNFKPDEPADLADGKSQMADGKEPDSVYGASGVRRNGKVARLPKAVREEINELLDDGVEYDTIIEKLGDAGKGLTKHNVSQWARGGYRDWVKEQERLVLLRGNFEKVVDALAKAPPEEIPDLVTKLLAARMGGLLSELTPQELQQNSEKHPQTLARLLALVPRLSREALRMRKFRRSMEREDAQQPGSAEAREKARTEFLDSMDELFGIRPYSRRNELENPNAEIRDPNPELERSARDLNPKVIGEERNDLNDGADVGRERN